MGEGGERRPASKTSEPKRKRERYYNQRKETLMCFSKFAKKKKFSRRKANLNTDHAPSTKAGKRGKRNCRMREKRRKNLHGKKPRLGLEILTKGGRKGSPATRTYDASSGTNSIHGGRSGANKGPYESREEEGGKKRAAHLNWKNSSKKREGVGLVCHEFGERETICMPTGGRPRGQLKPEEVRKGKVWRRNPKKKRGIAST